MHLKCSLLRFDQLIELCYLCVNIRYFANVLCLKLTRLAVLLRLRNCLILITNGV